MMKNMFTKNYSEMLNIFYGIQMSVITNIDSPDEFTSKDVLSLSSEPFSIISMPIPLVHDKITGKTRVPSLYDCFKHYCHGEKMEGTNAWFNDKTGQYQSVQKRISYWSLPNIMIIDLKRVQYTETGPIKVTIPVELPLDNLVMSEFVNGYKKESYVYDLYAVCNHHGSSSGGGHYTATIRTVDNLWFNFNDENVKPVAMNGDKISSNMPYCLFYRKRV
jgi:ubiquitin C-terminal hydrolase